MNEIELLSVFCLSKFYALCTLSIRCEMLMQRSFPGHGALNQYAVHYLTHILLLAQRDFRLLAFLTDGQRAQLLTRQKLTW